MKFVIDGSISDYLIVSAKHKDEKNIGLVLVDSKSDGINLDNKVHMDSRIYSDISFENVKIDKMNFLSTDDDGSIILDKTLDITRIGLDAEMLCNIQEAFEITMNYIKEREQFGVKIASFQALQHRSAFMFGEIELGKSIVLRALQAIDSNDVKKKYDIIVSIEIIEAVGEKHLNKYFYTIKENLAPGGRGAIQAIIIKDELYNRYRNNEDFIQKYIFPGGFLPSFKSLNQSSNESGLKIEGYHLYGAHYSNTLQKWRESFLNSWDLISRQGFDINFKKMWDFYFSYCDAGFK